MADIMDMAASTETGDRMMTPRSAFTRTIPFACALLVAAATAPAYAQDGGLGDLEDLLGDVGIVDGGDTGVIDDRGGFDDQPPVISGDGGLSSTSGLRSPIITDPSGAHRGAAVAARRPGLQIQQAISVIRGDAEFITQTEPIGEPDFFNQALFALMQTVLDSIQQFAAFNPFGGGLGGLGGLAGLGGFGNLGFDADGTPNQQTDVTPIDNSTTTGQGDVQEVN